MAGGERAARGGRDLSTVVGGGHRSLPGRPGQDAVPVEVARPGPTGAEGRSSSAVRPAGGSAVVRRARVGVDLMGHVEDRWWNTMPYPVRRKPNKVKTERFGRARRNRVRYI